ncbi:MAG: DNA polymerase I [Xanthomonadales bacterium]|nr:DNA polymerase I [Xanthomonadales bacterium]
MSDRSDQDKVLYLVDGSSYLYRAFHGLPQLSNSAGEPTGAILGVANMLRRLIKEHHPRHVAVVFDAPGKTFRHEIFSEYKATRPPMPEDLRSQVEPILEFVRLLGLPLLQVDNVEADDVIGTLARKAEARGMHCVISTGDKDLAQLVTDRTTLVNTMTDTAMDADGVREKFGVGPEQIVDFLALTGDKSDNIPGVEKCGPKTAAKWLAQWPTLDEVMAHADEVGGKIGEYLREALETLPLSRELATIRQDLDLDVSPEALELGAADEDGLRDALQRYEFNSWLQELGPKSGDGESPGGDGEASQASDGPRYETVLEASRLEAWVTRIEEAALTASDTETTDLDPMRAELVGISLSTEPDEACYIPLAHDYPGAPRQLGREAVLEALRPWLENPDAPLVGQHIKYDMNVLSRYGIRVRGVAFDTMLESYVFNSTGTRHDMNSLALKYLGHHTVHYEDIAGKGAKQLRFNEIGLEEAAHYAAEDADITLKIHQHLWPRLEKEPDLAAVLTDIEVPLIPVLARMEQRGVLIDGGFLRKLSADLAKQIAEIEKNAHDAAEQPFNLGSPKQLQEILFEKMGLPVIRKTPKGQPSTAEDVLHELAGQYELPSLILEHRQLSKLRSTYTDKLVDQINPDTGRVHTSYHQAVAATGRLSSQDPNLQNIPIRTEQGRQIRKAFVAPEGWNLLACDYSQIELRIMAHFSGDKGLLKAFHDEVDIHSATASEVFDVPYEKVDAEHRRAAKAINFGLMYGMSAFGLARQLNIGRTEAQAYMDTYFLRYPGVLEFMEETRRKARDQGYVETLFGRRLYLTDINASNGQRRQAAERAAINAPMQGTAADIIKRAMIAVDEWLQHELNAKDDSAHLLMQVHDELVLEVRDDSVEAVRAKVEALMSGAADLKVPLVVESGSGDNWDEAH